MTSSRPFFCAEQARIRGDSYRGTAAPATTWLLIEHRGAWPPHAFDGLALDRATHGAIADAAARHRARVLLIRRHGTRRRTGPSAWAVLRHQRSGHRQLWGTWQDGSDLQQIPLALTRLDSHGLTGLPPVLLVCAHGQHDACCAVRGRPVARALTERWPALTWECSHVGGDRFAASVVVAPDGVYYGNLDPTSAIRVIEQHLDDQIGAEHLRGYTDLSAPAQVAVTAVLARFGPAGRHAYSVERTARRGDRVTVDITAHRGPCARVEVDLVLGRADAARLTCRSPADSQAARYEVVDLRAVVGDQSAHRPYWGQ